jgi:hypothetical protein
VGWAGAVTTAASFALHAFSGGASVPATFSEYAPEVPMNKEDVIKTVSEKTGVAPGAIEKVVKAFESQAGDALTVAFEGIKTDRASLLAGISQKTGIPVDTCDKVLTALQGTVSSGISEKLGFLKGLFSR